MKIEIRSIIPAHRSRALQDNVEKSGCGWVRETLQAEELKETLHAQTQQAIVAVEVEEDVEAVCALLSEAVGQIECALPPYILVMGVGEDVAATMELYAAGADEVVEKTLPAPVLHARLVAIAGRLRRAEEVFRIRTRLEDAQEIGEVGSWSYNPAAETAWWSPQIYRVLDVDPADGALEFGALSEGVCVEEREAYRGLVKDAIENKEAFSVEFRFELQDGSMRRVHCSGRPAFDESGELIEFEGVMQNIEERWQAESKLRRQEVIFGYISEYLPAVLYQVRQTPDNDLNVEYITVGALKGFDKLEECKGLGIGEYPYKVLQEDLDKLVASALRASANNEIWADEFRVHDDNGEIRWMAAQSTPEPVSDGSIIWRGVLIDITERKLLNDQVQHADRLSTIGTMAAGVAHEVNNPLVYLLGNLQFVLELLESEIYDGDMIEPAKLITLSGAEIEEMRRALSSAQNGAERIRVIVEDLMTFGRASPVHDELVDLRRIGRSAARMMDSQIRHRATLRCSFGEVPLLRSNSGQLRQVLVNLLLNAAQAMTSEKLSENQIALRINELDGFIIIEVEDNGAGISACDKARLFEPFFTTKALSDGAGLGLYVCRNIIEEMGGRIEVESQPGEGSVFRVFLKTP